MRSQIQRVKVQRNIRSTDNLRSEKMKNINLFSSQNMQTNEKSRPESKLSKRPESKLSNLMYNYENYKDSMKQKISSSIQQQLINAKMQNKHTNISTNIASSEKTMTLQYFRKNLKSMQQMRQKDQNQDRKQSDLKISRHSSLDNTGDLMNVNFLATIDSSVQFKHETAIQNDNRTIDQNQIRQIVVNMLQLQNQFRQKVSVIRKNYKKDEEMKKQCVQAVCLHQIQQKIYSIIQMNSELIPNHYSQLYEKYSILLAKSYQNQINMFDYVNRVNIEKQEMLNEIQNCYKKINDLITENRNYQHNIQFILDKSQLNLNSNMIKDLNKIDLKQIVLDKNYQENLKQLQQLIQIQSFKSKNLDIEKIIENQNEKMKQPLIEEQTRLMMVDFDKLNMKIQEYQRENKELQNEKEKNFNIIDTLMKEKLIFQEQIIDLKDISVKFQQKYIRFKEISMLQREEIQEQFVIIRNLKKENANLTETVDRQRVRLDKVIKQKYTQLSLDYVQIQDDIDLIENVKTNKQMQNAVFKVLEKEFRGMNIVAAQKNKKLMELINDQQISEEVNIRKLQYFRPPFFSFIYQDYKTNQRMYVMKRDMNINYSFLSIIRYILDSKYNEIIQAQNMHEISKFPEFVYNWLGKYEYNESSQRIQSLDGGYLNVDIVRINFYQDIQNPKIQKLWECNIFKQFFDEHALMDEIYFYLYARYLLFQGPQMKQNNGSFDMLHYLKLQHVEDIVKTILYKFRETECEFIISKIRNKAKKKGKNQVMVDSGFVLALLLEYYRSEQKVRIKLIRDLFYSQKFIDINDNMVMTYNVFRNMIEQNFQQIDDHERAAIYRECFSTGHGSITADIFITVLNEHNYFFKILKFKTFVEDIPVNKSLILMEDKRNQLLNEKRQSQQQTNVQIVFQDLQSIFIKYINDFDYSFNQVAPQMGVHDISYWMSLIDQIFIKQSSEYKSVDFHFHSYLFFVQKIIQTLMKTTIGFLSHEIVSDPKINEHSLIKQFYPIIEQLLQILRPYEQREIEHMNKKNRSIVVIQKKFKQKMEKYNQMLKNYIRNQQKLATMQKSR